MIPDDIRERIQALRGMAGLKQMLDKGSITDEQVISVLKRATGPEALDCQDIAASLEKHGDHDQSTHAPGGGGGEKKPGGKDRKEAERTMDAIGGEPDAKGIQSGLVSGLGLTKEPTVSFDRVDTGNVKGIVDVSIDHDSVPGLPPKSSLPPSEGNYVKAPKVIRDAERKAFRAIRSKIPKGWHARISVSNYPPTDYYKSIDGEGDLTKHGDHDQKDHAGGGGGGKKPGDKKPGKSPKQDAKDVLDAIGKNPAKIRERIDELDARAEEIRQEIDDMGGTDDLEEEGNDDLTELQEELGRIEDESDELENSLKEIEGDDKKKSLTEEGTNNMDLSDLRARVDRLKGMGYAKKLMAEPTPDLPLIASILEKDNGPERGESLVLAHDLRKHGDHDQSTHAPNGGGGGGGGGEQGSSSGSGDKDSTGGGTPRERVLDSSKKALSVISSIDKEPDESKKLARLKEGAEAVEASYSATSKLGNRINRQDPIVARAFASARKELGAIRSGLSSKSPKARELLTRMARVADATWIIGQQAAKG